MSWLKWIFAYLFDCVHPHTTWPRRSPVGLVYVCCVDCGRELPYSLESMRIVARQVRNQDRNQVRSQNRNEDRNRKAWNTRPAVAPSRILVSALLLLSSGRAAAQTLDHSIQQTQVSPVIEAVVGVRMPRAFSAGTDGSGNTVGKVGRSIERHED
jgi:hypothetical protein